MLTSYRSRCQARAQPYGPVLTLYPGVFCDTVWHKPGRSSRHFQPPRLTPKGAHKTHGADVISKGVQGAPPPPPPRVHLCIGVPRLC